MNQAETHLWDDLVPRGRLVLLGARICGGAVAVEHMILRLQLDRLGVARDGLLEPPFVQRRVALVLRLLSRA